MVEFALLQMLLMCCFHFRSDFIVHVIRPCCHCNTFCTCCAVSNSYHHNLIILYCIQTIGLDSKLYQLISLLYV
jgi:hypothetical protein